MAETLTLGRRAALTLGAALLVPVHARAQGAEAVLSDWIVLGADDRVVFHMSQSEVGQGIHTAMAQILAEELDVAWDRVAVRQAPPGEAFRMTLFDYTAQFVGGSLSINLLSDRLRQAGATARAALVVAAAEAWRVPTSAVVAEQGVLRGPGGRSARYGAFAAAAAARPLPRDAAPKDPARYRLVGRPLPRIETPAKIDGSAVFGIDARLPGMLYASVRHCPVHGGSIRAWNDAEVKALPGVRDVVRVQEALVVVAESQWLAVQAGFAVKMEVEPGPGASLSSAEVTRRLRAALDGGTHAVARRDGDAPATLARGPVIEAAYETPYLAHATIEPPAVLVDARADRIAVWAPTQGQDLLRQVLAQIFRLPPGRVEVNTTYVGGSFGRKFKPDFVIQAAAASRAVGAPVRLLWTRDQDLAGDAFKPALMARLRATLGADGLPAAFHGRVVGQSLLKQIFPQWVHNGVDEATVEGTHDLPYAIPNILVDTAEIEAPVRLGFLRSVGRSPNAFFVETFLDELARRAGQDPVAYRLRLLPHEPRARGVIEAAARAAGWPGAAPAGRARGFAYHNYVGRGGSFTTHAAQVAEVSVEAGRIRVHKVWCAMDCGRIVNPNLLRAQVEGSIVFGLTGALKGKVTWTDGVLDQSNFDGYPLLTLAETPEIEVVLVDSTEPSGGAGEPAMPPVAPAVANAVFALTGTRLRSMPFDDIAL